MNDGFNKHIKLVSEFSSNILANRSPYSHLEEDIIDVFQNQARLNAFSYKPNDIYKLNRNGRIEFVKKTNDSFDSLYSTDAKNNINYNKPSIKVSKFNKNTDDSMLSYLARSYSETKYLNHEDVEVVHKHSNIRINEGYKEPIFNIFKFVSENSNVEWSVNKYEIMPGSPDYELATYHRGNLSPGFSGLGKWLGMVHSHPFEKTYKDRFESLYGDRDVGTKMLQNHGKHYPYLIYFPENKTVSRIRLEKLFGKRAARIQMKLKNFKF